ncbi:hypothetical protein ACFL0V_01195 [Nanoarchaeota archaeon]
MGLLNHLFSSTESIAREIELDDKSILKKWDEYLATVPKKKAVIGRLKIDSNLQNDLKELKKLLILELADISDEEKEESELISDLELIEHSQKVKRVHKLEQCLGYAETKYEYVYRLLHQLHSILKSQMHLVEKLLAESKHTERLISHIKSQFELELGIIKKIERIKTFHDLFLALAKGEHVIRTMDVREKRLLKEMQNEFSRVFSNDLTEGITYEWAMTVYDAIEDRVHERVADGMLHYHPDVDFEYVNRPEFVDMVREAIHYLGKKDVSEQMINVFVHLFREWYNHGRD